ncbi:hypothetical protein GCM10023235_05550 [Kitasatospora terrestris]|uniref:Uncharacterized protein n=1 Tax=Kitasatospora terrestris TaxID=258051 RepID=A0ABP9DEX2_9ACTN
MGRWSGRGGGDDARWLQREAARVGRAVSFGIRGRSRVRARGIHLNLTGEQAAALAVAVAEDEDKVRQVVGQALADCFNGGPYGGFSADDFAFDTDGIVQPAYPDERFRSSAREAAMAGATTPSSGGIPHRTGLPPQADPRRPSSTGPDGVVGQTPGGAGIGRWPPHPGEGQAASRPCRSCVRMRDSRRETCI